MDCRADDFASGRVSALDALFFPLPVEDWMGFIGMTWRVKETSNKSSESEALA